MTQTPTHIGPYVIVSELAARGTTERFLGLDRDGVAVVVQRLLPWAAESAELRDALREEADLLSRIDHPHVVSLREIAHDASGPYLVLEHVDGVSVAGLARHLLERGQRLPPALAAFLVAELCAGLAAAHAARDATGAPLQVVHRNVAPHNVLVSRDGWVELVGFTVVRPLDGTGITRGGYARGRYSYMAPEQVLGAPVDARTDVFAAGLLLHELLTGARVLRGEDGKRFYRGERDIPVPSTMADVPAALDTICMRALSRDPEERFATAEDLGSALRPHGFEAQSGRARLADAVRAAITEDDRVRERLLASARARGASLAGEGIPEPPTSAAGAIAASSSPVRVGYPRATAAFVALAGAAVVALITTEPPSGHDRGEPALHVRVAAPPSHGVDRGTTVAGWNAVHVHTRPAGALASLGGDRCVTPCTLLVGASDVPRALVVVRRGYDPFVQEITAAPPLRLVVTLRERQLAATE